MAAEFAGISVQAFDAGGVAVDPTTKLPKLCAYLQRYPETHAACLKDCFKAAAANRDSRKIVAARCYAGLSYRVIPIRSRNRPQLTILVGRVLTQVFGSEQFLGFIEKYKLSRKSFEESLADTRALGTPELDRIASVVRRLAVSFVAADTRAARRRVQRERKRDLIDFAVRATAFHERGPGQVRELLEYLGRIFKASGVAILVAGDDAHRNEVHSSIGLGESALSELAGQDWPGLLRRHGHGAHLVLSRPQDLLKAGIGAADAPLVVRQLDRGVQAPGYLVLSGAALSAGDLKQLEYAAAFVASRIVHLKCRERAEQKDEEARLLGMLAEKCLSVHSVEELLPLALEAAMCSLRAKRGSIFLADEEKGLITARALRGVHAPISETIESLQPGSVSHRVFFDRRPLLVRDTGQELGPERERQFPYATRSFVSVPLRENGRALGVLHLTEREGEGVFTPRDLSFLETLGLQAAGAIRKARLEEEVRFLQVASSTDYLTGVYNRRHVEEQLAVEIQRASRFNQPLAVAMLDIDGFKAVNDEHGHEAGDRLLRAVASSIRKQLRAVDILARYGGDEFVLVLPGTGAAGALNIINKIRTRIQDHPPARSLPGGHSPALTLSVGVSAFPETAAVAHDLLNQADQSLLRAKKSGRNAALLWAN